MARKAKRLSGSPDFLSLISDADTLQLMLVACPDGVVVFDPSDRVVLYTGAAEAPFFLRRDRGDALARWTVVRGRRFREPSRPPSRGLPPRGREVGAAPEVPEPLAAANLACNREGLACGFEWTQVDSRKAVEALPTRVEMAIGKVHGGMRTLEGKARAFLLHVTARPPDWHTGHIGLEEEGEESSKVEKERGVA